jgi:hypothetical protein
VYSLPRRGLRRLERLEAAEAIDHVKAEAGTLCLGRRQQELCHDARALPREGADLDEER